VKRLLVTGGAGFIGSNFIRHVLKTDPEAYVVNLDLLTYAGSLENLRDLPDASRHHFVHGDIGDQPLVERLLREHCIQAIVHFAAETHVDRSILRPSPFIHTNVLGTLSLLEAARKVWIEERSVEGPVRFHHISTDEVYGTLGPEDPPFSESTPYAPNSPYAASKAASDHLVRAIGHTYGLPVTITNCSNNYGPYQFPEKLIPLMILNAQQGKALPIYGDGRQIRDWLYVSDHCEAILKVLSEGEIGQTYNIGGDNQWTNLKLVQTLCGILDEMLPDSPHRPHEKLIRFVEDRPGHDRRYAMDIRKMRMDLGWEPRETLESGLARTVSWYLRNSAWVTRILAQPGFQQWMGANYGRREEEA